MVSINRRNGRNSLGKQNVNRFRQRKILIKRIWNTDRTIKRTRPTPGAKISLHISRFSAENDIKISFLSLNPFHFSTGQNLNARMSTDIRHLGAQYSDGTVHGGK